MKSYIYPVIVVMAAGGIVAYMVFNKPEIGLSPIPSPTPQPATPAATPNRGMILEAQKGTISDVDRSESPVLAPVTIAVTARQWAFEPATIRVKLGQPLMLRIRSIDVKHGIGISEFGVSADLEPGKTVDVTFTPDKTGSFTFFCNVFCGAGHRDMKGMLVVE